MSKLNAANVRTRNAIARAERKAASFIALAMVIALSGCGAFDGFGYASPAGPINFAQAPRAPGSADPFVNTAGFGNSQYSVFFPGISTTFNNPASNPPSNELTDSTSSNSGNRPGASPGTSSGGG